MNNLTCYDSNPVLCKLGIKLPCGSKSSSSEFKLIKLELKRELTPRDNIKAAYFWSTFVLATFVLILLVLSSKMIHRLLLHFTCITRRQVCSPALFCTSLFAASSKVLHFTNSVYTLWFIKWCGTMQRTTRHHGQETIKACQCFANFEVTFESQIFCCEMRPSICTYIMASTYWALK